MSTTSTTEATTADWSVWVPGIAAPIACFVIDHIVDEPVRRIAPVALPALAVIGIACLVISCRRPLGLAGLAATGPMWLGGGLALLLGIPLLAISIPLAIVFPPALLGGLPLWTGVTYLRQAYALTKAQAALRGRWRTGLAASLGAVAAFIVVIAADIADMAFIDTRLATIDRQAPETWASAFQSLGSYPLCGYRCRSLLCERLIEHYPGPPSGDPTFPALLDDAFKRAFGATASRICFPS